MTKFLMSATMILSLQLAYAESPSTGSKLAALQEDTAREPAAEKSFFETRTFEDVQDMVQSLTAATDDDTPNS